MPTDPSIEAKPIRALPYFLKVFIPLCACLAGAALLAILTHQQAHLKNLQNSQTEAVKLEQEVLETNILAHVNDAVFLAALAALALAHPDAQGPVHQLLERAFYYFSQEQKLYDQVRFLDAVGRERVRVDREANGSRVLAPTELQDKRSRYYFKKGMALAPGQIYISPFDLNLEHCEIERPFKPTLRFASPVKGPGGDKQGVVVLNLLGGPLLDRLRRAARAADSHIYLVNRQGWWLAGPDREQEWGFMLPERKAYNMSRVFPQAWKAMGAKGDGQLMTPRGLFTYRAVRVLNKMGSPDARLPKGRVDDFWWVVSRVTPSALSPPWQSHSGWIGLGALVLLAVLAALVWLWAAARARRAQAEQETRVQQKRLRAISNTALDAVVMVDSQGLVQFWNRAAEQLFGYRREEAMGRQLHELVSAPDLLAKAREGLNKFAQTGQGRILDRLLEMTAQRKDGSSFPAEVAISAFQMEGQWCAAGSVRDITRRKHDERELKRLANTDALTGAYNRRRFLELAEQEAARSKRYGGPLTLLMLDLDHFKAVNDNYGHEAGDLVLKGMVQVCQEVLREVDIFGRVGGEEFMALLPETGLDGAGKVAERLRAALAAAPVAVDGSKISYTASIGVAAMTLEMNLEQLMKLADQAMYRAKETGRNRVVVAGEGQTESS